MKITAFAVASVLALSAAPAFAQELGWYAGGSFGQTRVDIDEAGNAADLSALGFTFTSINSDESDTGFKIYVGNRFHRNFAAELSFFQLGEASISTTLTNVGPLTPIKGTIEWDTGFSLTGMGIAPLGDRFSIFGKAGLYWADTTFTFEAAGFAPDSESDSNTGLTMGVGAMFDASRNVAVRVEWERFFDVGGDHTGGEGDVDFISAGVVFRF